MLKTKNSGPRIGKKKTVAGNWKTQLGYYIMAFLPILSLLILNYLPMSGLYLAFIDYKPAKGIFGSEFVGLKHFIKFFTSKDFFRVFRNTLFYNVAGIALVKLFFGMFFALMLFEIKGRVPRKIFHTTMLLPAFLAWTVMSAALLTFLHSENGMLNPLLESLGLRTTNWYATASCWPYIIIILMIIKDSGMASIYFYSALLSSNYELYEAAKLDGANRIQQILHISIPAMSKVFCITLISSLGSVLASSVTPFLELTLDNTALYDTTQVIGTYIYNGLGGGRYSFLTAVGLVQSVLGLILVLISNAVVTKIDPESALF